MIFTLSTAVNDVSFMGSMRAYINLGNLHHIDAARRRPASGTLPNSDIEVWNNDIDISRYCSYKIQFEALKIDFDIGYDIKLRCRSFVTSISNVLILRNFDIKAVSLRYRSITISKKLRYPSLNFECAFDIGISRYRGFELRYR